MTQRDDEPARDAWLSEALRHAPDAKAAPPPKVSEAILREARNAVKTPRATAAPARINPLLQLWSWLARPPVAAGFATLTVATMVGVMWWDKPLDAPRLQAEAPAAASKSPTAAQAPAPATPPPPVQDEAKAVARAQPEAPRRIAAAPAPVEAPAAATKRERAVADRAPGAAATGELRGANQAAPAVAAAVPEPPPAPAAATDAVVKSAAIAQSRDEAAERRGSLSAQGPAKSAAPAAAAAAAPAPAPTALSLRRQDTDTRTPTIDQPERWTWRRGSDTQAMTPGLHRWLVQLDGVARWRPAGGAAPTAADGNVLQLWRDGTLRATITLLDDAVWLTPTDAAPVMAQLSQAAAASLRSALIAAAP